MCIYVYQCIMYMFNSVAPSMQVQDTQAVCLPGEAELQMGNDG